MNLRRRPMKLTDIDQCIVAISEHSDFDAIYAGQLGPLKKLLGRLVGTEGFRAFVFEDLDGQGVQLIGIGAIASLTDEFVEQVKRPPFFWIPPTVVHRLLSGDFPILSDTEVFEYPRGADGLRLAAWFSE